MSGCCSRGGRSSGSMRAAYSQPACPSHQHLMKYLDVALYFNGVGERAAQDGGCDGGRMSSGVFARGMVVCSSQSLFFFGSVKERGK